jgi:hypothetical protein
MIITRDEANALLKKARKDYTKRMENISQIDYFFYLIRKAAEDRKRGCEIYCRWDEEDIFEQSVETVKSLGFEYKGSLYTKTHGEVYWAGKYE